MSVFVSKDDIANVSAAVSQVIKDSIGQVAAVLVPAIGKAAEGALGGIAVTITIGPIEPIKIQIEVGEKP